MAAQGDGGMGRLELQHGRAALGHATAARRLEQGCPAAGAHGVQRVCGGAAALQRPWRRIPTGKESGR